MPSRAKKFSLTTFFVRIGEFFLIQMLSNIS
jgi:hypothetical protein